MNTTESVPRWIWRLLKFLPPRIFYSLGLGSLVGSFVLLLETTGRKSGLPRITPLQYEEIDGIFYLGSARGTKADWFRNLRVNPKVKLTVGSRALHGYANPITDPVLIAEFLELRLKLHPKMVGAMLKLEGMSPKPTPEQFLQYAHKRAFVAVHPIKEP